VSRYTPQEESRLLRRGPANPAAALTSDSLASPEADDAVTVTEAESGAQAAAGSEVNMLEDTAFENMPDDTVFEESASESSNSSGRELPGGTSLSATSSSHDVHVTSNIVKRVSRKGLRKVLPMPPAIRLFSFIPLVLAWIGVRMFTVLDSLTSRTEQ